MSRRKPPLDADALLVRSAARRVALTITGAVSLLVVAVLVAAFSVVLTQIPLGDLLHPGPRETVVDVDGFDILMAGTLIGVLAIASAALLGWLVTRRAVRPLVNALRRQRDFVADASHELRTPLAVLDARIQVLQRSLESSDPHAPVVADLRADSRALIGVVADLLDSIEIPKRAVSEAVPVAPVVESSIAAMRLLARQRDVTLVSRTSGDQLRVLMPASSLQRCVVALVDNAIKHSPAAGVVVVSSRRDGRHVLIDVADEGPGIQGISPDRVFERFARSAHAVGGGGSSRRGFGIGLALVQDAVTRYGGSAIVSATSDHGTTMTLRIPASAPST